MPDVMPLLSLLLAACSFGPVTPFEGDKPAPTPRFEDPGLAERGAGEVFDLGSTAPASLELPPSSLPDSFDPDAELPLPFAASSPTKRHDVYSAPSPFRSHVDGRRGAPAGVTLELDGKTLRYDKSLRRARSWRLHDDQIELAWPKGSPVPDGGFPVLRYGGIADTLTRRDPAQSGLPADEYVRYEVTHDGRTRPGLLLPAPAQARFELTLPEGRAATFDTHVTMAPTPLEALGSDGAWAIVRVHVAGEAHELTRTWVDGDAAAFESLRLDLSPWAGQTIQLELATDPYDGTVFDHVLFGSPTVWTAPVGKPRHIVVIGLDTTRPQQFGFYGYPRDTTPELDAIAEHATVFTRAWTPAPRTRPSFRSATTGRNPLDAVGATNIAEVFKARGFATAGVVANLHLQPRFDFHEGFDDWWFDGQAQAEAQVDRALAFLDANRDRDTYQFVHIMDPHMAYGAPGSYEDMFVEDPDPDLPGWFGRSDVYRWMKKGTLTEQRKAHIEALYDGELRYTSAQLARLYDQLDRLDGRTLVVMHNDHGEEFWEHGTFEHNHTIYDDVTRAILWFRTRGGQQQGATIDAPATLPDIAPTLYDFAGIPEAEWPPTDGRSLKGLLTGEEDASTWADRPIGIAHIRYGYDRWGVVYRNHKYILHTGTGVEELYDLGADPLEQKDLAQATDLSPWRAQLGPAHQMEAGYGWRIRVGELPAGEEITVELPQPASWALVVPPSMTIPNPANQAWGEPPRRPIEEIGSVALSEDRRTLTYTAGTKPQDGLLFVRLPDATSPDGAVLKAGDEELPLMRAAVWTHSSPERVLRVEPGTVFDPPPSEADRLQALAGGEASEGDVEELCALGYIHGPRCDAFDDDGEPEESP